jgi:hypothetical protein
MSDTETPKPAGSRTAIKLDPLPRWVLGVIGAAGMGGGSVAVFTREVEAGPVALIGIGAFFFLMGVVGLMPTRVKVGDNEAEWLAQVEERVQETFTEVIELLPPAKQAEARAKVMDNLGSVSPRAASGAVRGAAYEDLLRGLLRLAIAEINARRPGKPPVRLASGFDDQVDAMIIDPAGRTIRVELKAYTKPVPGSALRSFTSLLELGATPSDASALLVISRSGFSSSAAQYVAESQWKGRLRIVQVRGEEDLDELIAGIGGLLT